MLLSIFGLHVSHQLRIYVIHLRLLQFLCTYLRGWKERVGCPQSPTSIDWTRFTLICRNGLSGRVVPSVTSNEGGGGKTTFDMIDDIINFSRRSWNYKKSNLVICLLLWPSRTSHLSINLTLQEISGCHRFRSGKNSAGAKRTWAVCPYLIEDNMHHNLISICCRGHNLSGCVVGAA